jgi:hypothetical protein
MRDTRRVRAFDLLFGVAILGALVACGGDVRQVGGGGSDTGQGGEAGAFGDEYAASASIRVYSYDFELEGGFHQTHSHAGATYWGAGTDSDECKRSEHGTCTVLDCPSASAGPLPVLLDAGTVTITGGTSPITLTSDPKGAYSEYDADTRLFTGGESFVANVGGKGAIPGHQLSLRVPSQVTVPEPPLEGYLIDRRMPFTQTWVGGAAGKAVVRVVSYEIDADGQSKGEVHVACSFEASAGNGTIAPEMLALLPAGGGYTDLEVVSEDTVVAGDHTVTFSAQTNAITPSGFSATAPATVK